MQTIATSAREIFLEAIEQHQPDQWPAFASEACAGDERLRHEVERLLAAHARNTQFMARPAVPTGAPLHASAGSSRESIPLGTLIDRYKLVEKIGEGGMGVVYIAEQTEPVRRQVALKIIKPGLDTRHVIARFEAERQTLALMEHPNIARILDAGTVERSTSGSAKSEARSTKQIQSTKDEAQNEEAPGEDLPVSDIRNSNLEFVSDFDFRAADLSASRPYFVMELVRGLPITDYCDQAGLSVNERLELFITVCQAVQHAHQKGIIHRDLKPSNVLVTLVDGKPVPKVIDFGVAKATQPVGNDLRGVPKAWEDEAHFPASQSEIRNPQSLIPTTSFATGHAALGTLLYMSPEQATPGNQDIDTRSDVYSLGVLLCELLCGMAPAIKYSDACKSTYMIQGMSWRIALNRALGQQRLSNLQTREIEFVNARCLEFDRSRRYGSAAALALDLTRFVDNQPIEAHPPTSLYRLRKFCSHYRRPLIAAGLMVVAICVGAGTAGWQALAANRSKQLARDFNAKLTMANREKVLQQQALDAESARVKQQAFYVALAELKDRSQRRPLGWLWQSLTDISTIGPHAPDSTTCAVLRSEYARTILSHDLRCLGTILPNWDAFGVIWSPDGQLLAVGGNTHLPSGELQVHLFTGFPLRLDKTLSIPVTAESIVAAGEAEGVRSLLFSRDSQWLFVGTRHGMVLMFDSATGCLLDRWKAHEDRVQGLLILDNNVLVTTSKDGALNYWNIGDHSSIRSEHVGWDSCDLAAAGGWLFVAGGQLCRFPCPSRPTPPDHHVFEPRGFADRLCLSPDGHGVLVASRHELAIYDIYRGQIARRFIDPLRQRLHEGMPDDVEVSPNGKWALTTDDTSLRLWDFAAGVPLAKVSIGGRSRIEAAFHPYAPLIALAGDDRVEIYEIFEDAACRNVLPHSTPIRAMDLTPDGRTLAAVDPVYDLLPPNVGSSQVAFLDEPWTGEPDVVRTKNDPGHELAVRPTGDFAAFSSMIRNTVTLASRGDSSHQQYVAVKPESPHYAPDGKRLWFTADGPIDLVPNKTRGIDALYALDAEDLSHHLRWDNVEAARRERISSLKCVAVGSRLAVVGAEDRTLRWFDASSGQLQQEVDLSPAYPVRVALSGRENQAIVGTLDGNLLLFNVGAAVADTTISAHREPVTALALSHTGCLVSGSADGEVRFWQVGSSNLSPLFRLEISTLPVKHLAISIDGSLLALLYDGEGAVRLLHLDQLFERFRELGIESR